MSSQLKGKHIVVIGAGVIGLQTAITLLEAGAAVTIIAKHVPGDKAKDYTSPWAGAQWRTHATAEDKEIQEWDIESYNTWLDMVEKEKSQPSSAPKSGLEKYHSIFYWTAADSEIPSGPSSAWWAPHMRNFRQLPPSELPAGVHAGATYDSLTIDPDFYLPYLLSRARTLGAALIQAALPTTPTTTTTPTNNLPHALTTAARLLPAFHPALPQISAFVLATGIASARLVPDPAVHPIRGQTVLVRGLPRALTTVWRPDGSLSYVIPRATSGATVLGGTKQAGDWRADADAATTAEVVGRCGGLAPELLVGEVMPVPLGEEGGKKGEGKGEGNGGARGFEVLGVNVGFRPGRTGGPRVEVEVVELDEGLGPVPCCHEYGHAGAGYQNSFGSARKVVRLLEGYFGQERGRPVAGGGKARL
ncbi:d-amino acid oxidase [Diplodia corticola]|uniref:D-amino acid oxidase n=1 Tax=Diplodia corticola TaxID=236234 RepID=A0A1J9R674_9PEZI|nr:d-amino acid oxidase [Diplodia corticola]OJD36049.1 d-amino acid oxidase [Diplodia corticola]